MIISISIIYELYHYCRFNICFDIIIIIFLLLLSLLLLLMHWLGPRGAARRAREDLRLQAGTVPELGLRPGPSSSSSTTTTTTTATTTTTTTTTITTTAVNNDDYYDNDNENNNDNNNNDNDNNNSASDRGPGQGPRGPRPLLRVPPQAAGAGRVWPTTRAN